VSMNSFHRRSTRPAASAPATPEPAVDRHGLLRLDSLLVSRGLAPSRTVAQRLIAAGRVTLNGSPLLKAALELAPDAPVEVEADEDERFVSRGGLKLAGALAETGIAVAGKTCLDVGQSTGGFTDCLLQAGARHVVGVDVGHSQLHPRLRADPRVTALEGINCRTLAATDLGTALPAQGFDLIVGDVSFISMTLILPQLPPLLAPQGDLLLLVKPQFEVGPAHIGKGGIVRDPALYREVENKFFEFARNSGLTARSWLNSPITGGDGNREFFIWLTK
jgi:23S rRNA (cytidine1920-2'-O)/16S rRNA (cytidine1409-2'-O)-methyltransferase